MTVSVMRWTLAGSGLANHLPSGSMVIVEDETQSTAATTNTRTAFFMPPGRPVNERR